MDQELIAYLDARFKETAQQIAASHEETTRRFEQTDGRFEQIDSRFEQVDKLLESLEETTRHTRVLIEDLRHDVHLIAESVVGMNETMERYRREATLAFNQVKGWITPYYKELDGRVRSLDGRTYLLDGRFDGMGSRVDGLDDRIRILEGRADRQQGDVMDAIRKMLGKPPLSPPVTSE